MSYYINAYTRAKINTNNIELIENYLQTRLVGVLGPCVCTKTPERKQFTFDTFHGIALCYNIILEQKEKEEKVLKIANETNDASTKKKAIGFSSLKEPFIEIFDWTDDPSFSETYILFLKELIGFCGGGIIHQYDEYDETKNIVEIIPGKEITPKDVARANNFTLKMIEKGYFKEDKDQILNLKDSNEIPLCFFIGLSNKVLEDRFLIVENLSSNEISLLNSLANEVTIKYFSLYPNVFDRTLHMDERLNIITFLQYCVQKKQMSENNLKDYLPMLEEYKTYLKENFNDFFNVEKHTKGIEQFF